MSTPDDEPVQLIEDCEARAQREAQRQLEPGPQALGLNRQFGWRKTQQKGL